MSNPYSKGSPGEQLHQQQQYQQYQQALQQQHPHQNQHHHHQQQLQRQQQQQQQSPYTNPTVQTSLHRWFDAIDTDHSGTLSCQELQRALMNGDWTPFNVETVRLMMGYFDRDGDGQINFQEFAGLWRYIEAWAAQFKFFDLDGSGTIDRMELQKALRKFGYNLSEGMIALMITKYDRRGRGIDISFDNFVQCCVTIQSLTDAFRRVDVAGTGVVTMSYEQFLELVINNR